MYIEIIMVFSWNSFIVYYLDREGIFMSRLRGYFQPDLNELDLYLVKCVFEGMIFDNGLSYGMVLVFSLITFPSELT